MYIIQLLITVCLISSCIGGRNVNLYYLDGPLLGKTCIGDMVCDYKKREFYIEGLSYFILIDGSPTFTYVLEHPRNYNPHTFGPYDLCEELTENPKIVQQIINEMYFEGKDCDGVTKTGKFKLKLKSQIDSEDGYTLPSSTHVKINLFPPNNNCSAQLIVEYLT